MAYNEQQVLSIFQKQRPKNFCVPHIYTSLHAHTHTGLRRATHKKPPDMELLVPKCTEKDVNAFALLHATFRSVVPYLVTTGSAAWFGPQRPNSPLPVRPVLPAGFLKDAAQYMK